MESTIPWRMMGEGNYWNISTQSGLQHYGWMTWEELALSVMVDFCKLGWVLAYAHSNDRSVNKLFHSISPNRTIKGQRIIEINSLYCSWSKQRVNLDPYNEMVTELYCHGHDPQIHSRRRTLMFCTPPPILRNTGLSQGSQEEEECLSYEDVKREEEDRAGFGESLSNLSAVFDAVDVPYTLFVTEAESVLEYLGGGLAALATGATAGAGAAAAWIAETVTTIAAWFWALEVVAKTAILALIVTCTIGVASLIKSNVVIINVNTVTGSREEEKSKVSAEVEEHQERMMSSRIVVRDTWAGPEALEQYLMVDPKWEGTDILIRCKSNTSSATLGWSAMHSTCQITLSCNLGQDVPNFISTGLHLIWAKVWEVTPCSISAKFTEIVWDDVGIQSRPVVIPPLAFLLKPRGTQLGFDILRALELNGIGFGGLSKVLSVNTN